MLCNLIKFNEMQNNNLKFKYFDVWFKLCTEKTINQ